MSSQLSASTFPAIQFNNLYNFSIDTSFNHNSNEPFEILHDNYEDFLFLILSDQRQVFEKFSPREALRLEKLENLKVTDSLIKYVTAEIQLQWSVLHWRNANYIRSGILLKRAYSTLSGLKRTNPNFIEVNKSLGLLHILLSAIPDEYDWLVKLFGFDNNLIKGMDELIMASSYKNYFQNESKIIMAYVKGFIQNDFEASFRISRDLFLNQNSNTSRLLFLLICNKTSHNKEGLDLYKSTNLKLEHEIVRPIFALQIAELLLNSGAFPESIKYYKEFINTSNGRYFQANAQLKLFYALYLNNEINSINEFINENENNTDDFTISDKYAREWFKGNKLPNKELLKSGLFSDGGYFNIADSVISRINKTQLDFQDLIEYQYRLGRIKQGLGEFELAEQFFKKCIFIQGEKDFYFAPNACLQLGIINFKNGSPEKAKFWFEKALKYKNHSYKRSIDHQSKNYLNLI